MIPTDVDRMPWYARQRWLERQRRQGGLLVAPLNGSWVVHDRICTATFRSQRDALRFVRLLDITREAS